MEQNNDAQFNRVLKKHFLLRMNQKDVAESEEISTATVSRIINKAIDMGYVTYSLNVEVESVMYLEEEIKQKFDLDYVSVTHVDIEDAGLIANDVSNMAAKYLNRIIRNGDIIGVSWGNTLSKIADNLIPMETKNVTVIGLNGGVSKNTKSTGAEVIVQKFANNYEGTGYILPFPSFVDSQEIVNVIRQDSQMVELFFLIEHANILLFSVGALKDDSVLIQSGYVTTEQYAKLRLQGFVGDICSRYFKEDGSYLNDQLYQRVIGINLEELKSKDHKICIVTDEQKAHGLYGALKGGYVSSLFVDELTARALLDIDRQGEKEG
ncbi:MAG: sugar-binding domain-containing protein [Hespellia sp.]|nr:sugar-binding domain-containing protein [Hespellia sp.]